MEDLKIRQKCEEMIAYGYVALRQFPKFERHVLAAAAAQAALVFWSLDMETPAPQADPAKLTAIGGVDGIEALTLMGLSPVET